MVHDDVFPACLSCHTSFAGLAQGRGGLQPHHGYDGCPPAGYLRGVLFARSQHGRLPVIAVKCAPPIEALAIRRFGLRSLIAEV